MSQKVLVLVLMFNLGVSTIAECSGRPVVVAVIDTGVDFSSGRLQSLERTRGWDFVKNSGKSVDVHGHGTHVTGLIVDGYRRAIGTDATLRIVSLRYYDAHASADDSLERSISALKFAISAKVDIINYSGGGPLRSAREEALIREAWQAGILVIAAAGNEGRDISGRGYFPAGYGFPNILPVAALNAQKRLIQESNFSPSSVGIAALGADLLSALPGGRKGLMTGTSQATAVVAGVAAALIWRQKIWNQPERVIQQLQAASEPLTDLWGKVELGASLNAARSVSMSSVLEQGDSVADQRLNQLKALLRNSIEKAALAEKVLDAGVRP